MIFNGICNTCKKEIKKGSSWWFLEHEGHLQEVKKQIDAIERMEHNATMKFAIVEHDDIDKNPRIAGSICCQDCKTRIHNGFDGDINSYTKNYQEFIRKHYDHEVIMETDFAPELDKVWKDRILSAPVKVVLK